MRQMTVIRQEEQPFGVKIKSADRENPVVPSGDEILDARPAFRVVQGRDDIPRLVHGKIHELLGKRRFAVDGYCIAVGVDGITQ